MTETPLEMLDQAWMNPTPRTAMQPTPIGVIAGAVVERLGVDRLKQPRYRFKRFDAITARRDTRYLVKKVIPAAGLIVLWGRPKCGKSFWTFDLAAHVACGIPYRGEKVRQGPVVYIAAEGADGFDARIEAWRDRHLGGGGAGAPVPFHLLPMRLDLVSDHPAFIEDVRTQLDGAAPVLVVVDTLNRTYSGSESSDEDMTAYVAAADAIKAAFQCSVIVVHHCGHEATRPRGHSSLTGAADTQIAIRRDGDFVTATVEWNKDGPEGYVNVSRLDLVEIGHDADGDPVTTRVVVPCDARDAEAGEAARLKLTPNLQNALQALKMAIGECGEATVSEHVPVGVLTVSTETWRQYFYRRSIEAEPDGKPNTRRMAFKRASEVLQAAAHVGCWNDRVWVAAA